MPGFEVPTSAREVFVDITTQVEAEAARSGTRDGVVVVFVPHTTAGVTINENADPSVRADVKLALERLVPQSLPFTHREGNADAHVKASLMGSSVTVPLADGRLQLGTARTGGSDAHVAGQLMACYTEVPDPVRSTADVVYALQRRLTIPHRLEARRKRRFGLF